MKKFILVSIILGLFVSTLTSCGSPPSKATDQASTDPQIPVDGIYDDAYLYLNVSSKWEGGGASTSHGTCQVRPSSPSNSIVCDISIPEGQMYYSDITFTLGTKVAASCATINFYPYSYKISNSDTDYYPPGQTDPAKCATQSGATPRCWGGAAPHIVTDFPANSGMYFLAASKQQTSYTLPSGNSLRWTYGPNNYTAVNNMLTADRGNDINGKYVGGSMKDYWITCQDLWAHPVFAIKLNLVDEDTATAQGVQDEVPDWQ